MSHSDHIRPGSLDSLSIPNIYLLGYLRYLFLHLFIRFQFRGYEQIVRCLCTDWCVNICVCVPGESNISLEIKRQDYADNGGC